MGVSNGDSLLIKRIDFSVVWVRSSVHSIILKVKIKQYPKVRGNRVIFVVFSSFLKTRLFLKPQHNLCNGATKNFLQCFLTEFVFRFAMYNYAKHHIKRSAGGRREWVLNFSDLSSSIHAEQEISKFIAAAICKLTAQMGSSP